VGSGQLVVWEMGGGFGVDLLRDVGKLVLKIEVK
jgi:hypothetical protein